MKHIKDKLIFLLDGEVKGKEKLAMENHLKECRECSMAWNKMKHLNEILDAWKDAEPSRGLMEKTMERMGLRTKSLGNLWELVFSPKVLAPVFVLLIFFAGSMFWKSELFHNSKSDGPLAWYGDVGQLKPYKVVAIFSKDSDDPVSLLRKVNEGGAVIVSAKEVN